jgi:hypothetical protein
MTIRNDRTNSAISPGNAGYAIQFLLPTDPRVQIVHTKVYNLYAFVSLLLVLLKWCGLVSFYTLKMETARLHRNVSSCPLFYKVITFKNIV